MIKVLIVDDHRLVRTGIRSLICDMPDVEVVAEAASGEEAVAMVHQVRPNLVIMDEDMPGIGGVEATRRILKGKRSTQVLIIAVELSPLTIKRLRESGANGFLNRDCSADELVQAIRAVTEGQRYICTEIAQKLALSVMPGGEGDQTFESLSERELQVLKMVTRGEGIQAIAEILSLSPKTVSTYRYRLFEKLSVHNDVGLTHLAIRHGLVEV